MSGGEDRGQVGTDDLGPLGALRVGGARDTPDALTIEGIKPEAGEEVPSLDELIPPHEIEAVEMYPTPGQVPQRFTRLGTRCGVIVLWTRRGDDAR